jgi:hypothetical protein
MFVVQAMITQQAQAQKLVEKEQARQQRQMQQQQQREAEEQALLKFMRQRLQQQNALPAKQRTDLTVEHNPADASIVQALVAATSSSSLEQRSDVENIPPSFSPSRPKAINTSMAALPSAAEHPQAFNPPPLCSIESREANALPAGSVMARDCSLHHADCLLKYEFWDVGSQ